MNPRSVNPVKLIFILMSLIVFSSCGGVSKTSTTKSNPPPKTPPTHVVSGYLEALKRRDFGKTYEFISPVYAANLDLESYKEDMRKSLEKFDWSLLNYQILGAQILGDQALVVVEQDILVKPEYSVKEIQKRINVQYILTAIDDKWKISQSLCINNCVSREEFTGQGLNQ
jgi:hypothetical protein